MLRQTLGIMRELPRLHEIASVFIRHGLGDFVRRIGIGRGVAVERPPEGGRIQQFSIVACRIVRTAHDPAPPELGEEVGVQTKQPRDGCLLQVDGRNGRYRSHHHSRFR
jgi:hypothetical protein